MSRTVGIERGVTRTVFLVGPWAVKVPGIRRNGGGHGLLASIAWSLTRGVQANLSEAIWSGVDGVCPVVFSAAGLVNVYPRCQPLLDFDGDYQAVAPQFCATDRKPSNLGVLGGRVVWIDYDVSWNGCPHDPRPVLGADEEDAA